ncbi:Fic family protein [Bacteroides graminisolvens]|uniref:Fic family protein n=1 Tax=Bacteroides graminisolvens TaxID=477666 RepID=UPI003B72AEBB
MYIPPFTISANAINLIAEISAQIERYAIRLEQSDGLKLRKANRVKTIHSSLAIEGNTLSEDEVKDIIDGKTVVAPLRQIQEVKNAIKTYELYSRLNPFQVTDLLKAHGTMMTALTDDAGRFRLGGVGVFSEKELVHMAPSADRVPTLIADLFEWLKEAKDHLLIRSCVFHYEFEFIHPFSDGNGRMGRLWQSLILGRLHPLFEHLPVENMVYANQEAYYNAIETSTAAADSAPFIDFMLQEILNTLKNHQGSSLSQAEKWDVRDIVRDKFGISSGQIVELIRDNPHITLDEIASVLSVTRRSIEKKIKELRDAGYIKREGSNKTGRWVILV